MRDDDDWPWPVPDDWPEGRVVRAYHRGDWGYLDRLGKHLEPEPEPDEPEPHDPGE